MLFYLLLLFTVLPITEFMLLAQLSEQMGLGATVLLVLATGAIGASLARQQGLATLMKIQRQVAAGQMPGEALVDGAMILVAGAVLITPGVLTDAFGFALLIPAARSVFKRFLKRCFASRVQVHVTPPNADFRAPTGDSVIDAEVISTRVEEPRS